MSVKPAFNILYTITPASPEAHVFEVVCCIQTPDPDGQIVYLPAWIPGSYMIRDFAKNITKINAVSNQQPITLSKQDKQTWRCEKTTSAIEIRYKVYAWDLSVRTAHLDTTHAFFNGSSVFLAIKGLENEAAQVTINLPAGEQYKNWRVATTLSREHTELFSAGNYSAQNYEELIDHPVEMGQFDEINFSLNDIPHHIIVTGIHSSNLTRLTDDVKKICQTHINMFGELPEMERYMFLLTVVGTGYGGLEHRSSTALICNRKDLPTKNMQKLNDDYVNLLGLFSHEYFHTWNIKRIKPEEFIPYSLQNETYTELLWAFEGITSYYDELGLVRSGTIDEQTYLELLGKNITRVMRGAGRHKQTLLESSYDAWTKFYQQDENAPNAIVSYYVKGALFAMCLDLKIRATTENKNTLDDVMRELWISYGKEGTGITNSTIPEIVQTLTKTSLNDFFTDYLNTTNDLPLDELLKDVALTLEARATDNLDDAGGKAKSDDIQTFNLGVKLQSNPLGAKVQVVYDGGAIQQAGIASGDVIIAVNKLKASKETLLSLLSACSSGDHVIFDVFRRDELISFTVKLQEPVGNTYFLITADDSEKTMIRTKWFT
ncbi:Putative protease [hydrothermal vent metagenome]|uniref:Protease n=1 Tax=hydrothermal vent metagenome TaxID=652676 RepID=A0A3B1AE31_9ZZZZ